MTTAASNTTTANSNMAGATRPTAGETRQVVLKDIRAKWNKFSEQDVSALKSKDELVAEVVARYGMEKTQAQRDVDSVLKGRLI
jgi:hypothetical protein